jgi:hypothetical protein
LTMFMTKIAHKILFTLTQRDQLYSQFLRDTTLQSLLMDKLVLVKHTRWKALSTMEVTHRGV